MDMRALAKQLKTKQHTPKRVIFEFEDHKWEFNNPKVVEANMMGNIMFQVIGKYDVVSGVSKEDISLVIEKTNCSESEAKKALEETNDVAEAILQLSE